MPKIYGHLFFRWHYCQHFIVVKNIFRKYSEVDNKFSRLPYIPDEFKPRLKLITKGITPSKEELTENNRARSARLRIIERIGR